MFRLTIPRGTRAFATHTDEYEILLGKHQFRLRWSSHYQDEIASGSFFGGHADTPITVYDLEIVV
jgi:hypothetical protein